MRVEVESNEKQQQVNVHYVDTPAPCVVEEKFGEYNHGDLALAELLQVQEYQSLQGNSQLEVPRSSSSANSTGNPDRSQSRKEGNSSETMDVKVQLELDEALAREYQEMENQLAGTSLGENAGIETDTSSAESSPGTGEGNPSGTSAQVAGEDDIDPDNMTYEERQSLSEGIGAVSRGLADEVISYLPSSTYKTGLFSRKDKHEECIICLMAYKNRDKLITLPSCKHQYHKHCIARWLKDNKECPVCKEEVFG